MGLLKLTILNILVLVLSNLAYGVQENIFKLDSDHSCKVGVNKQQDVVILTKISWGDNCPTSQTLAGPFLRSGYDMPNTYINQTCNVDSVRDGGFFVSCYVDLFLSDSIFTITYYRPYYNTIDTLAFIKDI